MLTLGGGIVFTPIATALTVVALRRTRPETLVDFGALLVEAAAVAFYTLMFVWTVGLVLYEVLLSARRRRLRANLARAKSHSPLRATSRGRGRL